MELEVLRAGMPADVLDDITALYPQRGPEDEHEPFSFHAVEVKHAVELLQSRLPDFHQDAYSYMSFLYDHLFFVEAAPHLTLTSVGPDMRRRVSEHFGVGVGSLFMVKTFGVAWRSIEQIELAGKGRPDFRAQSAQGRYVFEAKGTTVSGKLNSYVKKGRKQKRDYRGRARAKLVLASLFKTEAQGRDSLMRVVDPPVGFDIDALFTEDAELRYARRHFMRSIAFAVGRARAGALTRKAGDPESRFMGALERSDAVRERLGNREWLGRTFDVRVEAARLATYVPEALHGLRVFRGIDAALVQEGVHEFVEGKSPYRGWEPPAAISATTDSGAVSYFDDGTVLSVDYPANDRVTPPLMPSEAAEQISQVSSVSAIVQALREQPFQLRAHSPMSWP